MKCRLETNSYIYDILSSLQDGYESGDFRYLFPYLAPDCVMESQWVLEPNIGYDAVVDYFTGKGEALKKAKAFPECSIVELIGICNPINNTMVSVNGSEDTLASLSLPYTPGKLCLLMEQTVNNETNGVIVDVQIDDAGMVKRIDLCMPELFRYRDFCPHIGLYPAQDDEENEDAHIRVGKSYFDELSLFLACVGSFFGEYDDLHIPMETWRAALELWKSFCEAPSFDEAFERIAGVDYERNTVADPEAAIQLGRSGKRMWVERHENRPMLEGLLEWTELYKDTCNYVNTYGW